MTKHSNVIVQHGCGQLVRTPLALFQSRILARSISLCIQLSAAVSTMVTKRKFEFWGPVWGPAAIMLALPVVNYGLVYSCSREGCVSARSMPNMSLTWRQTELFNGGAVAAVACWAALQVLLHVLLPGVRAQGAELPGRGCLTYKLTGLANFCVTVMLALYLGFWNGVNLGWAYDNFVPLLTVITAVSWLQAAALYLASFRSGTHLAAGGSTGHALYDFFMGRELNPRIGWFDVKEFCELYPGIIGWVVLDLAMAHKQYTNTGRVSAAMVLVFAFQTIYAVDSLIHEKSILTTMDIKTEGFGWMLTYGDLAWVPFVYSLQARYLVDHPQELSTWAIVGIMALKLLGYTIFRLSNSQKDLFRQDPNHRAVRHLKTITTDSGRKLLVSGWWGTARHINYLGDWLMGLAWCLPCGFEHAVPYFYVIYFAVLLVHRERRDDHACRQRYGKAWDRYCQAVPYRLIPYVY